jgi:FMN reductase
MRKLVVVTAGLSTPSSSRLLADRLAAATAAKLPVDTTTVELRDVAHEITDHLLTGFPPARLKEVLDAVAAADGLILVTPIFQASYSGLFKSFADLIEKDVLDGRPVLLAATGGSVRHSLALDHAMRPLFSHLRAAVLPTAVFAATDDWGNDASLRARIEQAAAELATEIDRRDPAVVTDPFLLTTSFEDLLKG